MASSLSHRASIAALLTLLVQRSVTNVAQPHRSDQQCRKTSVAVLGAGMAGITAAKALSDSNVSDFVIIEYQDRIGGRAQQTGFGKDGSQYTVELGCNWIQGFGRNEGPAENQIWTLSKKYHFENTPSNWSSIITYNETGPTDFLDLIEECGVVQKRLTAEAGRFLTENLQDESARSGLSLAGWNPKHSNMSAQVAEYWVWDWNTAKPPEDVSMVFTTANDNITFVQWGDGNYFVTDPRGFGTIVRGEASSFLKEKDERVLFNKHITNITYSDEGVSVYSEDGSCVSAAYAICTFSLGILQNDVVNFEPKLPLWKETAIQTFGMGTYTKIFFQFPETFWPEDTEYFVYASPTQRGYYPVWQSLSKQGFLPGSNIIFVTVTGEESYRVEQQTDEQTKQEALEVLRLMFPDKKIPGPTAFLYPRWAKTPWAFGSFSAWPIGTSLEMHQNLRANLGRLWFAGEATSSEAYGYLQGAYLEGVEAGQQVTALLQKRCATTTNGTELCGERSHYEELHGTTPLDHYNVTNGWTTNSLTGWSD